MATKIKTEETLSYQAAMKKRNANVESKTCRTCKYAKVWSDGGCRCNLEWRLWTADEHTCGCYKRIDIK